MNYMGKSEWSKADAAPLTPCEVVSLVSMVIQHCGRKQFTIDSLLKYFNSSANDAGSVSAVMCVIMGRGAREEMRKIRRGRRKEEERSAAVSVQEVREEREKEDDRERGDEKMWWKGDAKAKWMRVKKDRKTWSCDVSSAGPAPESIHFFIDFTLFFFFF